MPVTEATPFDCPNCGAQYKLVRVETNETLPTSNSPAASAGGRFKGARAGLSAMRLSSDEVPPMLPHDLVPQRVGDELNAARFRLCLLTWLLRQV